MTPPDSSSSHAGTYLAMVFARAGFHGLEGLLCRAEAELLLYSNRLSRE